LPFTPFHLGPGLLMGLLLFRYLDLPTVLVASVILDVEPALVLFLHINAPLHGFFHSFLGGTFVAILLTAVMRPLRARLAPLLAFFRLEQRPAVTKIALASLAGIYLHILLDARMHLDIRPFYPFDFNPFLGSGSLLGLDVTMMCVWCFFGGLFVYAIRWLIVVRH
jgi:membrane-bound metal-dependent hydrolase YbcI (DUF457 family)